MLMHNPPHPGQVVRRMLIEGAQFSVTESTKALEIERVLLSKLINGKSRISLQIAVRLSLVLNTSSEMWINMQNMYDLWHAEKKRKEFSANNQNC